MNRASAWAALFAGLLLVSTAAPFIRLTRIDPFALVLLRMGISAPLFLAFASLQAGCLVKGTTLPRQHLGGIRAPVAPDAVAGVVIDAILA